MDPYHSFLKIEDKKAKKGHLLGQNEKEHPKTTVALPEKNIYRKVFNGLSLKNFNCFVCSSFLTFVIHNPVWDDRQT